jgi:hypothetical protein
MYIITDNIAGKYGGTNGHKRFKSDLSST